MGYGIVMWLDDVAARQALASPAGVEALGVDLVACAGSDSYPVGGLEPTRVGPWQRVGAFYSSHMAAVEVTSSGAAEVALSRADEDPSGEYCGVWVPQLRAGEMARRTTEAMRHPHRLAMAQAQGQSLADAVYGTNPAAGTSSASLWWLYADALAQLDRAGRYGAAGALGRGVAAGLETHLEGSVSLGSHAGALNKAGSLVGDGPVVVLWSGNRMCRAEALTERELPTYLARAAR